MSGPLLSLLPTRLALWPVTAQVLDPSTIATAPPEVRAAVAFFLTVLVGGATIYRDGRRVQRALEAATENALVTVVYGLMAFLIVAFFAGYLLTQLVSAGLGGPVLQIVGLLLLAGVGVTLGGLGFAVVGTWVADVFALGDPWLGLVLVGAVSALAWLVLPVLGGLVVWLAIAAVGIGGATRRWIHSGQARPAPE